MIELKDPQAKLMSALGVTVAEVPGGPLPEPQEEEVRAVPSSFAPAVML